MLVSSRTLPSFRMLKLMVQKLFAQEFGTELGVRVSHL
ncbi:hypothetical protein MESS2_1000002 [Mesorhizobium metallidurans STM 2683]|uniref:Uncharacterized protein n=5 Tax=Mesorhizobium TaxID=68287 RepID=A0A1R3V7N1_9HYPH|nr:conserved hypothetical protein [Mesorhizobium ventifaucium]CAH2399181.1 conserved hypothetical protein [Mesorhizobium escarrei]CCV02988.1 hypothetical protein MESS2_1000002 [Mesorhizobium metallidurans STM 2683]SIT55904.1 conserved hypothetical protein [Mesorhizobium prunaredense]SJM34695.1 conserved hypothetical protein [Mesorhizobium delmotii]